MTGPVAGVTVTTCKGPDCGRPFAWVPCIRRDGKTGKVPLDLEPVEPAELRAPRALRGLFVAIGAEVRAAVPGDVSPFYQSHFNSCPNAELFRRGRRADDRARSTRGNARAHTHAREPAAGPGVEGGPRTRS